MTLNEVLDAVEMLSQDALDATASWDDATVSDKSRMLIDLRNRFVELRQLARELKADGNAVRA